jgi:hypothetical protein
VHIAGLADETYWFHRHARAPGDETLLPQFFGSAVRVQADRFGQFFKGVDGPAERT